MTVHVVARIVARPDTVAPLRALLQTLVEPTRKEAGCISYRLLNNVDDATDFTFVEEWRSSADVDAHMRTAHVQAALAKVGALVAAAPDIRSYRLEK